LEVWALRFWSQIWGSPPQKKKLGINGLGAKSRGGEDKPKLVDIGSLPSFPLPFAPLSL